MKSYIASTDLALLVPFEIGGESVVPDLASVTYTLRDNIGATISGSTDIAVTTTVETTEIAVPVPSAANTKSLTFEYRTVSVKFKFSGQTYFIDQTYRLIDRIPMSVSGEGARSLIGLAANELPDEDIDFPMAYYLVCDDLTKVVVDAALIAGTTVTHAANKAIAVRALIELLPSLQMRANSSEKSQTASASRLIGLDIKRVEAALIALYATALAAVTGATQTALPLLTLVTPTDVITGA